MRKLSMAMACAAVLSAGAYADVWIIAPDSTLTDTAGVKALSGATSYQGKKSTSSVALTGGADSAYKFTWSVVPDAADDGNYGTTAGLLIPANPDWSPGNFLQGDTVQFQIKGTTATDTAGVVLIIGSDIYPKTAAAANAALTSKVFKLTSTWTTVKIPTKALLLPSWYASDAVRNPNSDDLTTFWSSLDTTNLQIGKDVTNFNFQPQNLIAWAGTPAGSVGTVTGNGAGSFEVRDIRIAHAVIDPNPVPGVGCSTGPKFVLDAFAAHSPATQNLAGGYWFAFSDSDTTVAMTDTAKGNTHIILPTGKTVWVPDRVNGVGILNATLEKDDVGSPFLYHAYAGWADLGTNFLSTGTGPIDLSLTAKGNTLNSIAFDLYTGSALSVVGTGYSFDTTQVLGVVLKVSKASVADAEPFQLLLPARMGAAGAHVCVDLSQLAQPSWYVKNTLLGVPVAFKANDISQIAWEVIIKDQKNPSIHTATAAFGIGNVELWGVDSVDMQAATGSTGIRHTGLKGAGLRASYEKSLVLSYAVGGTSAQVDVVRLDGSRVASFKTAAVASDLSLPVQLSRGTYLVSVRGDASRLVGTVIAH